MVYEKPIRATINWDDIPNFKEIKTRQDGKGISADLVYELQAFRNVLNAGMTISPVNGALVDTGGHSSKSYHYPAQGACAADWFPAASGMQVLHALMRYNPFTGIGFYFDCNLGGKIQLMLHADLRPAKSISDKVLWIADKNKYTDRYYYVSTAGSISAFMNTLVDRLQEFDKKKA